MLLPQENQTSDIFVALGVTNEKGTLYTNLTGKFPLTSVSSGKYVLIAYDYDSNGILAIQQKKALYQLVEPHNHQVNAAKRAIQTFKNHFIAGLCSTDPDFPLYLWDTLIPQAYLTLNLLQRSRTNPKLSAHAQLNGNHDFNVFPLAPPGARAVVYDNPNERSSWAPH
eukprot:5245830-Ditylum_brightwellii.AAC.1